jgi:hypothetical protein
MLRYVPRSISFPSLSAIIFAAVNISKMSAQVPHYLFRTLLVLFVATLAVSSARPNHFGDPNQVRSTSKDDDVTCVESRPP